MQPGTARPSGTDCDGRLARLSARAMLEGYRARHFTPVDVIEDVIAALRDTDAVCNVVVTEMYDSARREAAKASAAWAAGEPAGALAGIPVTVKDLLFVAGVPAHAGAPVLADFVPEVDSAVVALLKTAGAVITCKTTTCESGYKLTADSPLTGVTRNPWRLDRTSGGSSGGAAAAVAAGCGPLAIGTDGVGSIRVPSAFCGVFGLKPTFGLVPRAPSFFPPSWASLAHTGPIGRTVADVALLLEVIAGHDVRDEASLPLPRRRFDASAGPLAGLRIGFSPDLGYAPVDPEVRAAFLAAVDAIADLGATMLPDHPQLEPDVLETVLRPIAFTEQAAAVGNRTAEALALSDPEFQGVVGAGRIVRGTEYVAALHRRALLRRRFLELFERVDALLTPTVPITAFAADTIGVETIDGRAVNRHLGWSPFSWPCNLAGVPAASVPCGFDGNGLPIGVQIVAPWLREDAILRIAAAYEAASDSTAERPAGATAAGGMAGSPPGSAPR
jgi:aspartyl-tRNA(Asn)/glutamyl-tRNA(Gln) amidotransferase subunit A